MLAGPSRRVQLFRQADVNGGKNLAIKVAISHPDHAAAWSRARQAQAQIAARLACSSLRVSVQQPRWSLLEDAESGGQGQAATAALSSAPHARPTEDASGPAVGHAIPAYEVLMEGFLYTKNSSLRGQDPNKWSRRWVDLASSCGARTTTQLRMFHTRPADSCAPPLALFSLATAEISR